MMSQGTTVQNEETVATESTSLLEEDTVPRRTTLPTPRRSHPDIEDNDNDQQHARNSSLVPNFVFTSIDNINEAIVDAQEQMEDLADELLTFEPLDEEAVIIQAEEDGYLELETVATAEDREDIIEEYLHPDDPMDPFVTQEKLGVLPLAVLVFYNVSGGPFGIEQSVRSGGNFYALLGFLVLPFVWSCQEALMTAELGTTFPEASGGVAWVEEAFGPSVGWMAGYLGWIAGATDNAIYPVLFLDYLLQAIHQNPDDINPVFRFCTLSVASILLGYVNWRGLPVVGKMSTWICFVAMSPFIVLILAGASKVEPSRWFEMPGDITDPAAAVIIEATDDDAGGGFFPNATLGGVLWRPFLNNLFWNLNSFDAAGSFAGEVENSATLFPRAMLWGVVMVMTGYFFPLLVAIGASDSTREEWVDGYLARVTGQVIGPWLGAWTVFAAGISNIALFQAELSADAFQLMGMADRGHLPKLFSRRSRHGTPTNGIILGTAVIVVLGVSDFESLIEMLNFNYAIALLLEYCSFIKLRISKPNVERPYKIPLGTVGCAILFAPSILLTLLVLSLATYATYAFVLAVNVVGFLVLWAKNHSEREDQIDARADIPSK